jgi:pentatricopeptide repeat protein
MIDLSLTVGSSVRPSCLNFNVVLCALSRDHRQQAATQAIELLEKMELPITEGGYDVRPDKMSYAMTILACSRQSDHTIGAKLAERLLERMENCARAEAKQREEVSSAARPLVEMDIECYNVVLTAISKSQDKDAVDRIFRIITRIANDASNNVVRPNMRSWNAALNALSRVKTEASAQQAEELLEQLFESYNNGTLMEKPNEFSYAAVLGAYQKVQTEAAARRADEILKHMDELYENGVLDHPPDVFHCTIVCSAWAKSGSNEAPKKCLEILSRMTARYKEGFPKCKPTTRCFAAVLDCFSRSNMPERAETLLYQMLSLARQGDRGAQPDAVAFDIVIYAFLNSNLRDAGQRAELVLERGLEFAQDEGGEMLKLRSFTAILGYYGSQKQIADSPYRAEYILNRLITLYQEGYSQLSPTVSCFTKVMDAYASQANQEAGPCAENLLKTMIKLKRDYGAEQLEVNTGVMNCVLNAWQASVGTEESGRRAERLLDLMEEKHDEGNFNMSPNFSSYTKVIATWSKSPVVDKADRALAVLNRMKKRVEAGALQVRTSDHAYGLVINACAFTPFTDPAQQMRLFEIAQEILNELLEVASREGDHRGPNAITYGWFFQALERLDIPEDLKYKSLERAFKICCTKGRLSQFAWSRMREATTGKQFMKLLRSDFPQLEDEISDGDAKKMINYSNLPMAWSRIESSAFNHGDRMTRNYKSS